LKGEIMDKTQEKINIARVIYEAYPHSDLLPIDPGWDCCDLAALLERVTTHDIGDGLFRFMVVEIVEGGESTLAGAIRVMERAREDIEAVLHALQDAAFNKPVQPKKTLSLKPHEMNTAGTGNEQEFCRAAEYIAEQGRSVFTGHMIGGLWNARTLDVCIMSGKEGNKAAYEFLVKFGDQYAQQLSESQKQQWQEIKNYAAALLETAEAAK
jgi:hypothetical protein